MKVLRCKVPVALRTARLRREADSWAAGIWHAAQLSHVEIVRIDMRSDCGGHDNEPSDRAGVIRGI